VRPSLAAPARKQGLAGERGAVTAELAVGLPVVILLLLAVLTISAASGAQLRALDAARAGARAVAIGQDDAAVRSVVERVGGTSAAVRVERDGAWVVVQVSQPVGGGWFSHMPWQASGEATAWVEP
jgi:Flp pilus assembly protein TadG